jgi:hypothetical protein
LGPDGNPVGPSQPSSAPPGAGSAPDAGVAPAPYAPAAADGGRS